MAYINQEDKQRIAKKLKAVIPSGWKYSLAIRHHSKLVLTVSAAPFDLIRAFKPSPYFNPETATHAEVSRYHYRNHLDDECVADAFDAIFSALNDGNHDNSDVQTDYFDVGWYVDVHIGRWNRPFEVTAPKIGAATAA